MNICKSCNAKFTGKFCDQCGQKVYTDADKSVKHIFTEAFHFLTHFEGTFFTTLKTVLLRPGQLSIDYANGVRKKYYKPISLYFLIVIIYLLFPFFKGLNKDMSSFKGRGYLGNYITAQIEKKIASENTTEIQLANHYNEKSKTTSKILLFLLIPISALLVFLLHFYKKKFAFDIFIVATELNLFFLIATFIILPMLIMIPYFLFKVDVGEDIIAIIAFVAFGSYSYLLFRKVFAEKWPFTFFKSLAFVAAHLFITFAIYTLLVFEITFALI